VSSGALFWVIGAGGHAKVVIDTARAAGLGEPAGVLDDDPVRHGTRVLGVPVRGAIDPETVARFRVERAVLAVGHNHTRSLLAARLDGLVEWATIVHPAAVVSPAARLGEGTVVFAGSVIQADATLGRHAIINTGASIDHDCAIGDFVHIAPGARLAGNVYVEQGALLGIGACVIPGRRIGAWSVVGAGGVVIDDIPPYVTATGVPARTWRYADPPESLGPWTLPSPTERND
jgi:sugar O-acyltransferase (sialic acid O-acetyltransferase NeuD family)